MGFFCRHCGNTFERLEHMEMHSESFWKSNKVEKECNCTLCFCYRTKKHIDLCDMEVIIDDVKMGNPVSECLERLYRDEVNQDFYKCYGPTEKDDNCKKPLHPGKVANDLLVIKGYRGASAEDMASPTLCGDMLSMNAAFLAEFFGGYVDICHSTAYKLAKVIDGTDVRFWMDLQERYDEYMRKNK